jgi:hypothetical protein
VADSVFVQNCLDRLHVIPNAAAVAEGIEGSCDLSAIADAATYANDPRLPSWVSWIEYDFEGGMSPPSEFSAPLPAVTQFAQVVHAAGKRVWWAPTYFVLMKALNDGDLAKISPLVDGIRVQYQNQYTTLGQFVTDVATIGASVHKASPSTLLAVQLWTPTQNCATMVQAFALVNQQGVIDGDAIGTHSDGATVACVVAGLRP